MKVSLVYSPGPRQTREWLLELPPASTVADAVRASGLLAEYAELTTKPLSVGIWGQATDLTQCLAMHDRVEVYRNLRVDPKVARRERFTGQGIKRAGLFSQTRKGAKAGY